MDELVYDYRVDTRVTLELCCITEVAFTALFVDGTGQLTKSEDAGG